MTLASLMLESLDDSESSLSRAKAASAGLMSAWVSFCAVGTESGSKEALCLRGVVESAITGLIGEISSSTWSVGGV